MFNGENWLKEFEQKEKERTGINILKVGYNKVFGYYIEVTNSNLNKVPSDYIRKQTLTNGERYITDELKKHEDEVLTAQVKAYELEYKLFSDFRNYSKEFVSIIRNAAECIAKLDVFTSFAAVASENNYVCPFMNDGDEFIIKNGRHPVLEQILPLGTYVANDIELSAKSNTKTQFMILTGPNMAGKSTYMRQNALIAILAQAGSYVPADFAEIGLVDKIFTRVGASDDLTLGKSTFMVEMTETACIALGNPNPMEKVNSVGMPYPNEEIKIVNGELWIKGDNLLTDYIGTDEQVWNDEGWFQTGDLARIDEDGYVYLLGRIKDVIILQNGTNIYPSVLEARFNELPFVKD
jgi:DNA mismatch repair ATPase MutS